MNDDSERDVVEDALVQMGHLDAAEAAIERAEAEGSVAEVPVFSSAKLDAIVAASLNAATPAAQVPEGTTPGSRPAWMPWVFGVGVAIAAALVLWTAPPPQVGSPVGVGPLPATQPLKLGGTARNLGDAPPIRAYGPGDAFFVELSFDAAIDRSIVAELFAFDSEGGVQPVPLSFQLREDAVTFEGEIAELLSAGVWTLQVRYGKADSCSAANQDGCLTRETRIEVVAP